MYKTEYLIVTSLVSLANIFLAAFVFLKGRNNILNRVYSFWVLCVGLWSFFLMLNILAPTKETALLWCRWLHVWAIIIPPSYVHFVLLFLNKYDQRKKVVISLYLVSICFLLLSFSPWFISASYRTRFDFFVSDPRLLYPLHLALFVGAVFYVYYELLVGYFNSKGVERKKIKYFFVATLSAYSGGITNYFINYDFLIFPLYPYANIGVVIYVLLVAALILKYQFLDIQVIIKKTLVFAGLASFTFGIFALVTFILQNFLGEYIPRSRFTITLASVFFIVSGYEPIRRFLIDVTDRFLFQKRFEYRQLLKEASKEMAAIKSLDKLSKVVVAFLVKKARLRSTAVFAQMPKQENYVLKASRPFYRGNFLELSTDHPLIHLLKEVERPIDLEEATNRMATADLAEKDKYSKIMELMGSFSALAVVPSFLYLKKKRSRITKSEAVLRSLIFLGPKKSDEAYTQEDMDIFFTLAQESSVAIENARLYDEAIQRNLELERTNVELRTTQSQLVIAERKATMVGFSKAIGHEVNNALVGAESESIFILRDDVPEFKIIYDEHLKKVLSAGLQRKLEKWTDTLIKRATRIFNASHRIKGVIQTLTNILKESKEGFEELNFRMLWEVSLSEANLSTYEENLSECKVEINIPKNLTIKGNQGQLQRVIVNLIKNAYEAMIGQRERIIRIRGEYEADPRYVGMVRIEISDNGPGIAPDVLRKIFLQGFSTKPKPKEGDLGAAGQGQGLYVSKHIIESVHGGSIEAQSTVGVGTTFILRLPALRD